VKTRRLQMAAIRVLIAVTSIVGVGCGSSKPPVVDFSSVPREYRSEDYPEVYERWTRHEKVLHDVESALEIWSTYKSFDFREAFVAHYAQAYSLTDADRQRLRHAQSEAAAAAYEFLVTAQSANYRWNDLEKKNSPWRVSLRDRAGHELGAEAIKVEKLPEMFEREFFPAKTPFTKTYSVRFVRPSSRDEDFAGDKSGMITLRFSGAVGHADLTWSEH
jgi:hypothetical protein